MKWLIVLSSGETGLLRRLNVKMWRDQGTYVLYNNLMGIRKLNWESVVGYWNMGMKKTEQNRSKKISVCLKKSRVYHWRCWGETLLLLAVLTELRLFLTFGSFLDRLWNIHFSRFICVCVGGVSSYLSSGFQGIWEPPNDKAN